MPNIYAIDKKTEKIRFEADSIALIKHAIAEIGENENNFLILQEFDMKYISRIVYIDGECIYNNKDFWCSDLSNILENYEEHEVLDFMGNSVGKLRFETELNNNRNRAANIDGKAGQIEYNMAIGNEIISLLREECIETELKEITPLQIAAKTAQIIPMLQTGSFREANQLIAIMEPDEFFTEERLNKYSNMIAAADVIQYAT